MPTAGSCRTRLPGVSTRGAGLPRPPSPAYSICQRCHSPLRMRMTGACPPFTVTNAARHMTCGRVCGGRQDDAPASRAFSTVRRSTARKAPHLGRWRQKAGRRCFWRSRWGWAGWSFLRCLGRSLSHPETARAQGPAPAPASTRESPIGVDEAGQCAKACAARNGVHACADAAQRPA